MRPDTQSYYDPQADVLFIAFKYGAENMYDHSLELNTYLPNCNSSLGSHILLDLSSDRRIVGIELRSVSLISDVNMLDHWLERQNQEIEALRSDVLSFLTSELSAVVSSNWK
ncbi:DUF2283 domain-containing protein [Candidatus Neomarinimicrobiota bacterium]